MEEIINFEWANFEDWTYSILTYPKANLTVILCAAFVPEDLLCLF